MCLSEMNQAQETPRGPGAWGEAASGGGRGGA